MFGDTIRYLRQQKGYTQAYVADVLHLNRVTYNRYENNEREPDLATLQTIANFYAISLDELVTGKKQMPPSVSKRKGVKIPVLGRVVAGIPLEAISEVLDYEEISESMAATGEFFALIAKGSSMNPTIIDGDTLIVRKQSFAEEGRVAIILVNGNEATVKRTHTTETGITLIADNPSAYVPHFYTNEEIEHLPLRIIGKVVEIRRKML